MHNFGVIFSEVTDSFAREFWQSFNSASSFTAGITNANRHMPEPEPEFPGLPLAEYHDISGAIIGDKKIQIKKPAISYVAEFLHWSKNHPDTISKRMGIRPKRDLKTIEDYWDLVPKERQNEL